MRLLGDPIARQSPAKRPESLVQPGKLGLPEPRQLVVTRHAELAQPRRELGPDALELVQRVGVATRRG